MERKFSLAYLTIPGVEPLEQIKIAAEAGYDYVSLRTIPMGLPGEPQICLEKDPELFKEVKKTLTNSDGEADDLQKSALKAALKKLKEIDPSKEEFIQKIAIKTDKFTSIKKAACEQLILTVNEMIENYGIEKE